MSKRFRLPQTVANPAANAEGMPNCIEVTVLTVPAEERDRLPVLSGETANELLYLYFFKEQEPRKPRSQHYCGLQGFNPMLGDTCPACDEWEEERKRNAVL